MEFRPNQEGHAHPTFLYSDAAKEPVGDDFHIVIGAAAPALSKEMLSIELWESEIPEVFRGLSISFWETVAVDVGQ